jgi:hypothetical protein
VSLTADHELDLAGYSGPPSFGLALHATCSEPANALVVIWKVSTGNDPTDESVSTCFEGSFNPGGTPVSLSATGCGSHVLTVTPESYGSSLSNPKLRPVATPMRFAFGVC